MESRYEYVFEIIQGELEGQVKDITSLNDDTKYISGQKYWRVGAYTP